jgi:D-alanine-D-alanine ligase
MTLHKIRVGVLRGGPSDEYEVSLKTGAAVIKNLPEKYMPIDVFISKNGVWYLGGIERPHERILNHIDVAFIALHGTYGEDGTLQGILEAFGIPYTGSKKVPSAVAMNKALTKQHLKTRNIKMPRHLLVRVGDEVTRKASELHRTFHPPYVIKPMSLGSSVGVDIVEENATLPRRLCSALKSYGDVLIEEYIEGKEATCGVIDHFRGAPVYSLLPVEISPPVDAQFFDYGAKYGGASREICPGNFRKEESSEIQKLAACIHEALGLRHYSRSDFIVHPKRGVYFLEVNTLPGMTEQSLFPKSLHAVGSSMPEFLDHLIMLALAGK